MRFDIRFENSPKNPADRKWGTWLRQNSIHSFLSGVIGKSTSEWKRESSALPPERRRVTTDRAPSRARRCRHPSFAPTFSFLATLRMFIYSFLLQHDRCCRRRHQRHGRIQERSGPEMYTVSCATSSLLPLLRAHSSHRVGFGIEQVVQNANFRKT